MTQYQVTVNSENVQDLFTGDGLARLLENVLNQVLSAQAQEYIGARPYERTEDRQGYRNGYRSRELKTRIGKLRLSIPRLRDGSFSPELFERMQRSEQALVLSLKGSAMGSGLHN